MTSLTYGLKAPDDGDQSSGASGWFSALRANFVAIDAHTHNGVNSPLISIANVSPLTTKGDLMVYSGGASTRIAVGSDAQILTADSTQTAGIKWAAPATSPDSSYELSNLSLAASVASNALTVSLKTKSGSDPSSGSPVKIGFRSSTAATGTYNQRSATAATSVVVSSGSTLGNLSATNHYLYVYALDNSGTIELGISTTRFDDGSRQSTTAEGGAGAADSNAVIYSTTARSNVPVRIIGRLLSNQTTAGTWAAVPTEISLVPFARQAIIAIYETNTARSITTGTPTTGEFLCEDRIKDTHNIYNTTSAIITIPRDGDFRVTASVKMASSGNWNLGERLSPQVYKNGSANRALGEFLFPADAGGNVSAVSGGSAIIPCVAGDTLEVRILQQSGAALALNGDQTYNWTQVESIDGP